MNETTRKSLEQVVADCGKYPIDAFEFIRSGLNYAVQKIHGDTKNVPEAQCHVSGQQLSEGLRQYAILKYGIMARAVLAHWHITRTQDFGQIVWAMVEARLMQKTDHDDLNDFDDVFNFMTAFDPPVRPSKQVGASFKL